jgi:hypothetical protein
MSATPEEIKQALRGLADVSFEHEDGYRCFKQFDVESTGLDPETTEQWILDNGGHLKHVRIPEHIAGHEFRDAPDSAPCYMVPLALLD